MAEYIEREAVKKTLHDSTTEMEQSIGYSSNVGVPEEDINYVIDEIPSADVVEVVHGEWVETYQPLGFDEVKCAECSSCGEDWIMDDDVCIDDYKAHWKYCPCCGAKMDGKENGNNGN